MLDTAHAQIFVFGLGTVEKRTEVSGVKTRRSSMGGWSQARYQRRADNFHLHHVQEVVDTLDRTVRDDNIQHIIVSGDEVAVPLLKEALPAHLREKLLDVVKLDRRAVEHEIAQASLEALRQKDAETDQERVQQVIDAWRAGALGVAGPEATLQALQMGQVDELLITATPQDLKPVQKLPDDAAPPLVAADTSAPSGTDAAKLRLSDELVARAEKTGARIRMIENADLLRDYGGVAALLRFRI
jgi:peptide subunit release factor 1 (eRF1)